MDGLPLPSSSAPARRFPITRRWRSLLVLLGCTLSLFLVMTNVRELRVVELVFPPPVPEVTKVLPTALPRPTWTTPLPPNFYNWHDREKALPQHNMDLPAPQGRHGRYIWFANNVKNLGWGNVMQEIVLNAHLAYLAKRTYVFDNYTWEVTSEDYSDYNGKPIPARIPLTALLAGPIAGDPFPPPDTTPPAVIPEFFDLVCVNRTVIDRETVNGPMPDASAAAIYQAWIEKLEAVEDPCVEIEKMSAQIFDFWLFGDSRRLLDVWPSLWKSPILQGFKWSPLITDAVEANRELIHPAIAKNDAHREPLPGLLALHIRRGDFVDHCTHLANWSARFVGFNEFPQLPDKFVPPEGGGGGFNTDVGHAIYRSHCFPDIPQIVRKVMEVRESPGGHALRRVYVLTNGPREWLAELKEALHLAAPWTSISTSRDLTITHEQKYVAQAIDMLIAQRADVFIGNGFSSMTSNVVMVRQAQNQNTDWDKIRFW
ncbi:hypothetical protein BV25DRAFT_1826885 [Artomyces pyxidatus]|uniref:Uncharacterized protein n=1 Tax=Artomyces pyxidatus TaxID=48021 RepID=A0ACB8SZU8_9AGAM|nr:hypothetical protein BV25DRAFT_1826885 [Artomyces pyxidatus]